MGSGFLALGRVTRVLILFVLAATALPGSAGLPSNWRFSTPLPQGNELLAAWAGAPNDLYVGGPGGNIQHWNGTNWSRMSTPSSKAIYAMHGLSNRDIWAVGGDAYTTNQADHSLILHWDGTRWTNMVPPNFSGWTYPLTAVWAVGAKDVWATTDIGTFPVRYNGTSWQFVSVPLSTEGSFKAIRGVAGHVFFVGTHGQIMRYSNGQWALEQKTENGSFSANILTTIWGTDLTNLYVGGSWGQVYRRNGDGSWTDLGLGTGLFGGDGMTQIYGTSSTNIYILGTQTIRHYNGSSITQSNSYQLGMRGQWLGGAGVSNHIYGVGPGGVVTEFIADGTGGGAMSPLAVGGESFLSMTPKGAVPCGTNGALLYGSSLYQQGVSQLVYFDGAGYHSFPQLPAGLSNDCGVNAVWAGGLDEIVVAWNNLLSFERGVHRWTGTQWQLMGNTWNQPYNAAAFWASPSGTLYACTPWRITRWNGTDDWVDSYIVPEAEMQTTVLNAIWGRSESDIFVGAKNGKILRYDGSTWKAETTPGPGVINAICGNSTNVFAVGDDALVWRRTTSGWTRMSGISPSNQGDHFKHLVARSDGVYAIQRTASQYTGGGLGFIWKLLGSTATNVVQGLTQTVEAFTLVGTNLFAFSTLSAILCDNPEPSTLALERLDLAATNWSSLGVSRVALRVQTTGTGRPMVAAWHENAPGTFLNAAFAGVIPAAERWILRADQFNAGSVLPPAFVRFHYDASKIPSGVVPASATLFRFNGTRWEQFAASVDPVAGTLTSLVPAGTGEWTFGWLPRIEAPTLSISSAAQNKVLISWPGILTGAQLEQWSGVGPAAWSPVAAQPSFVNGTNQVLLDTGARAQLFRLRVGP